MGFSCLAVCYWITTLNNTYTHILLTASNQAVTLAKELKIYKNGNLANIFLYAGNGKYFQELFALTLNRIVVSG